jgi:DNA-binding MarR family transcriptional regulator
LTATDGNFVLVDAACRTAVCGRRAVRALSEWARRFGLGEAEFQILWQLRSAKRDGLDQTALASALACSPAQISAIVERLRVHGEICEIAGSTDRRRHRWQLSPSGQELVDRMLAAAALLRYVPSDDLRNITQGACGREAAA